MHSKHKHICAESVSATAITMKTNAAALLLYGLLMLGSVVPAYALPNLYVGSADIYFSQSATDTVRGSTITITATIHNVGADSTTVKAVVYDDDNAASNDGYSLIDSQYWAAQSFWVSNPFYVSTVTVYGYDRGDTYGDSITLELRNDDGSGKPGALIESVSSTGTAVAHWQDFSFSSTLPGGATYWAVMKGEAIAGDGWKIAYDSTTSN